MGMFDWYEPRPPLECPRCGALLSGWQGKSGPRLLFEWVQGVASPPRQLDDGELGCSSENREGMRLPDDFEIHTKCESCETWIEALGLCDGRTWTRVIFLDPLESPGLPDEWMPLRGDDRLEALRELQRELPESHVLAPKKLFPIARHRGRDDVLIRTTDPDASLWVVHLTWNIESDPRWPSARSFRDVAEFRAFDESEL